MKHNLSIEVKQQSIALERFLRVTRHRGFNLTSMNIESSEEKYIVNMMVDSDRPIYLLTQQLKKLVEVNQVEILDTRTLAATN
ncbi:acetolactate synthase 2 small subunit [Pseudoalteromonas sp. SSM20]|jgi:acetolactate synthase II small subunit|uniref:acetolactate synthase 2 small subunit n=1 Tax=unclassified Pseudoalteromonas TaxID=194690 RepID=UPI00237D6D2A|nr:acetolactate synthase 2 small subunit [Pseudoalteromonas sp. G4]MDE3271502.1 acetolactate synthase 2 small subunit [Pseudoalteromonas sp. G4]